MTSLSAPRAPHEATRVPALGSRLAEHLAACPGDKVAVCLGLALGICVPYFGLQQLDLGAPLALPATAVDRAVAFGPGWTWVYFSLGGLVPMAPWLAGDREQVLRYAAGLALLCVPSFLVFALLPVAGPRPESLGVLSPGLHADLYGLLAAHDRPTNSLPSLHAGLTVYSLLVIDRVFGRTLPAPARTAGRVLGLAWGLAILYATLATKQHWALDLPPGVLLAAIAYAVAWRSGGRAG